MAEEAAQVAKVVAVADVDIAKASQELLSSKIEGGLIKLQYASCKIFYICVNTPSFHRHLLLLNTFLLHRVLYFAEKRYFVEVVNLLDKQVQEMKLMTNAIGRLEGSYKFPFHILV